MGAARRCCPTCFAVIYHIAAFAQILVAIAIILIVSLKLSDVSFSIFDSLSNPITITASCFMGPLDKSSSSDWFEQTSSSLCNYTYAVCGISLAASLAISIAQCITCGVCSGFFDIIFAGAGVGWWAIAAGVIMKNVSLAADQNLPLQDTRNSVVILAWVDCGLFGLMLLSGLLRCMFKCCTGEGSAV